MFLCNKHIFEYQIKKKTKNLLNKVEKYDKEINKELKESKNLNSKKFEKEKDCIIF
jgi:adenine-specific DNA methylase